MSNSVTGRIKAISQPRGGYLPAKMLVPHTLDDSRELFPMADETVHPSLIGTAVDSLTRACITKDVEESFKASRRGAQNVEVLGISDSSVDLADYLISTIKKRIDTPNGLTDDVCSAALILSSFDVAYRNPLMFKQILPENQINQKTLDNVKVFTSRSIDFFSKFGPIISSGFEFDGAYTNLVSIGDGDYLTNSTLWDMKVSKTQPTKDHTLQLLMYYLMGLRSIHGEKFKALKQIGLFNPRLHTYYTCSLSEIPDETLRNIEKDVIGY